VTSDEARIRLRALGLDESAVAALLAHFEEAERRGKTGHGLSRIDWLETLGFDPAARPVLRVSEEGFERWDGHGALGYLVLEEIVRSTLDDPPVAYWPAEDEEGATQIASAISGPVPSPGIRVIVYVIEPS